MALSKATYEGYARTALLAVLERQLAAAPMELEARIADTPTRASALRSTHTTSAPLFGGSSAVISSLDH